MKFLVIYILRIWSFNIKWDVKNLRFLHPIYLIIYFLSPFFSYPKVEAKRSILNALITELKSLEP